MAHDADTIIHEFNDLSALCATGCGKHIKVRSGKYCSPRMRRVERPFQGAVLKPMRQRRKTGQEPSLLVSRMHAHRYKIRVAAFLAQGGVYGHVPFSFLSRMLRERYGERCSRCGWAERHPKDRQGSGRSGACRRRLAEQSRRQPDVALPELPCAHADFPCAKSRARTGASARRSWKSA